MSNTLAAGFFWSLFSFINVVTAAAYAVNPYRDVGDPITTVYSIEQHKSGSQVWWIDQLSDGQMVFATANGLSTWDGESWQQASSPSKTRMRALSIWHDGNIYAGATNELGYFSKLPTGKFTFTVIPSAHLLPQFGQTRGVNSNDTIVVYNTDECALIWDGTTLHTIKDCVAKGSRVFKIDGELLITDKKSFFSVSIDTASNNSTPVAIRKPWQFPPNVNIKSLFLNARNQVIMVTNMNGLFILKDNIFTQVISPSALPINAINSGIQGSDKYYYINSSINGMMVLSEDFALLRHYQQNDGLGLATTYDIFQDKQDNIWLAGLPNISVFQPPHLRSQYRSDTGTLDFENIYNISGRMFFSGTGFYLLTYPAQPYYSPIFKKIPNFDNVVLDMVGLGNELLVGTDSGVYSFEFNANEIGSIPHSPKRITSRDFVSDLAVTPDQSAVFTSIGNHLSKLTKSAQKWQETRLLEDKSTTEYIAIEALDWQQKPDSSATSSKPQADTKATTKSSKYAVWVSTESRDLYRVSNDNDTSYSHTIRQYAKQDTPFGSEHIVPFTYNDTIMIGAENGVYRYQQTIGSTADEAQNDSVNSIIKTTSPSHFTINNALPLSLRTKNKDIFKMLEDPQGRLWYHAGSDTGVVYENEGGDLVSQESIFKPYNNSGTRGLAYANDAIWFGVTNGSVFRMSVDAINTIPSPAKLHIAHITSIDNGALFPISKNPLLIPNDNNSIRIGYALADYSATRKTQYRSKLDGQKPANWSLWSAESSKDFTQLSGGDWTFSVEAVDPWGRSSNTDFEFSVQYPWYLSIAAWLSYAVALMFIIIVSIKIGQRKRNAVLEEQNVVLETKVIERTNEINQKVDELKQLQILKDRFFANVSHEFRTPLTLTIGPLQSLITSHRQSMGKESLQLSLTALSNAKKMLALVGQVLDINRLELGTQALRVSEFDIAKLLNANAERFTPWAEQQQQTITCVNCENPYLLYGDQDQVDKCVSNLLSNAIKYSGENTHINVSIVCQTTRVGIQVSDNGNGLSAAVKDKVFERFYQAPSTQDKVSVSQLNSKQPTEQNAQPHNENRQGSGIGLHMVKEITTLHRGEVELVTQLNEGCQFTLWFINGHEHFTNDELIEPIYLLNSADLPIIPAYDTDLDKATVLIVDDNPGLRQFMSQNLSNNYQVLQAQNGEQGIAWALKYLPDIIVSDVSMPGLSGLEMTKQLKSNNQTSSIPILLLSAQTSKRDIVTGFSSGANDYLTKPFDTSELIMRIRALLDSCKNQSDHGAPLIASLQEKVSTAASFDSKVNAHIIENIANDEFSVDSLAKLLFMSKETLRRKCHQAMGMTPAAYIQKLRIEQSKLLLDKQILNVSEVAYAVGFDSLAYFSRQFKKHYGIAPSSLLRTPSS